MGRNRIPIEKIQDERKRLTTFKKRKDGLLKKAMELSVLCDVEIAIVMFSKANGQVRLHDYASNNVTDTLAKLAKFEGPVESKNNSNLHKKVDPHLQILHYHPSNDQLSRLAHQASVASKRRKEAFGPHFTSISLPHFPHAHSSSLINSHTANGHQHPHFLPFPEEHEQTDAQHLTNTQVPTPNAHLNFSSIYNHQLQNTSHHAPSGQTATDMSNDGNEDEGNDDDDDDGDDSDNDNENDNENTNNQIHSTVIGSMLETSTSHPHLGMNNPSLSYNMPATSAPSFGVGMNGKASESAPAIISFPRTGSNGSSSGAPVSWEKFASSACQTDVMDIGFMPPMDLVEQQQHQQQQSMYSPNQNQNGIKDKMQGLQNQQQSSTSTKLSPRNETDGISEMTSSQQKDTQLSPVTPKDSKDVILDVENTTKAASGVDQSSGIGPYLSAVGADDAFADYMSEGGRDVIGGQARLLSSTTTTTTTASSYTTPKEEANSIDNSNSTKSASTSRKIGSSDSISPVIGKKRQISNKPTSRKSRTMLKNQQLSIIVPNNNSEPVSRSIVMPNSSSEPTSRGQPSRSLLASFKPIPSPTYPPSVAFNPLLSPKQLEPPKTDPLETPRGPWML